jgi:hypothetical protein
LQGGRLDVVEGCPVAALVYSRREHPVNGTLIVRSG